MSRARVAVLVSGSGRSLLNLLELERRGELPTETVLVVSSRPGVAALEHAERFEVPTRVLSPDAITAALDAADVELVVMAGYLKHWPIPARYVGRTINIHPALLPLFGGKGFYGDRVHKAALASGMRISGCTVHFVTENYDEGPTIGQRCVPIRATDDVSSLAARVFAQELKLLPECIRLVTTGDVKLENGRAVFR